MVPAIQIITGVDAVPLSGLLFCLAAVETTTVDLASLATTPITDAAIWSGLLSCLAAVETAITAVAAAANPAREFECPESNLPGISEQ